MKKLTLAQKISLAFILVGVIISSLEAFGVAGQIVGALATISGGLKMAWDAYLSFTAENMVEFSNEVQHQTKYHAKSSDSLSTEEKLEVYRNK